MALVSDGFFYSVTLVDNDGNETTKRYELQSANYAEAVADGSAIITALLSVSDGAVSATRIEQAFVEDALVLPTVLTPISEIVSVTARKAGAGNKKANYSVPMPKEAIMSGNALIVTNAAVGTYNDLYLAGAEAYISDGENLAAGDPLEGVRVTKARRFE